MSIDQGKSLSEREDRPVLFGPANDPKLAEQIKRLTGASLASTIASLDTFINDRYPADEDPFPFGIEDDEEQIPQRVVPVVVSEPVNSGEGVSDGEAADGLDRILDELSEGDGPSDIESPVEISPEADKFVADEPEVLPEPEPVRGGLIDLVVREQPGEVSLTPPLSPIADMLVRAEAAPEDFGDYLDQGIPEKASEQELDQDEDDEIYDPLPEDGLYEDYAEYDEDPDAFDPDFDEEDTLLRFDPDPDLEDDFEAVAGDDAEDRGSAQDRSYALPEPSPFGNSDGMSGYYDEETPAASPTWSDLPDETDDNTQEEPMAQNEHGDEDFETVSAALPRRETAPPRPGSTGHGGSDLEDLMSGLLGTDNAKNDSVGKSQDVAADQSHRIPSFMRRDENGDLPVARIKMDPATDKAETIAVETVQDDKEPEWGEDVSDPIGEEHLPAEASTESSETDSITETPPARSGRKRLLAGVALIATLAAGAGVFLSMHPELIGAKVATAPSGLIPPTAGETPHPVLRTPLEPVEKADFAPVQDLVPMPDQGTVVPADPIPETVPVPAVETAQADPAPEPAVPSDAVPVANATPDVPAASNDVSALLAEIDRTRPAPVVTGASEEQVAALEARLADMETRATASQDRAVELANELTGLTGQITDLLQRDSDQAERLERAERLIRGQSAILAQFGQMQESLEQTQVVLLDVSGRIGAVEAKNPADRDAVNRALADVEGRIQALTANMSIIARMSIEGVDALKAPNASAATAGVQTAPEVSDGTGGRDTVFRSETGGFRITSDAAGRIPTGVKKDDFIEGYGYVLDVIPASDGKRLVVMENGSVLIPAAE